MCKRAEDKSPPGAGATRRATDATGASPSRVLYHRSGLQRKPSGNLEIAAPHDLPAMIAQAARLARHHQVLAARHLEIWYALSDLAGTRGQAVRRDRLTPTIAELTQRISELERRYVELEGRLRVLEAQR